MLIGKVRLQNLALFLLSVGYLIWSGLYIFHSSYVAIDGQRYFGLADDAMISMRYAWNFAHGQGLVWNAGQRVEGYSNLFMTLLMSAAAYLLNKKMAVLAIQVLGIPTVLITAYLAAQLAVEMDEGGPRQAFISVLTFACVLIYYPLSYWTLMGMETGLLALNIVLGAWLALRWLRTDKNLLLGGLAITAGLAYLTRNDSLILTAVTFAYLSIETYRRPDRRRRLLHILFAALLVSLFPIAQTLFRYAYYGELLPNTYMLKLTAFPFYIRLIGGARFVLEFLGQSWLVIALAALGLLIEFRPARAFQFSFLIAALAYQIYVGGDPWSSWRLLAPAMPALFIVAIGAALAIVKRWRSLANRNFAAAGFVTILMFAAVAFMDHPFFSEIAMTYPTADAIANFTHTNAAIAVDALTSPGASVGVIWAGTLPYYSDRYGIDFLGKSDAYIARLPADISGSTGWGGMISVPGHNKYDLQYSIVQLGPTYIQAYSWGYETVKPWVVAHYVRVEYHGITGAKTIWLLKDSPMVCWEACRDEYKIIPWPHSQN